MSVRDSALLLAWIVILLIALALAGLARQIHTIAVSLGLQAQGSLATDSSIVRSVGQPRRLEIPAPLSTIVEDGDGRPTLVIAISRSCASCERIVAELAGIDQDYGDRVRFALVDVGGSETSPGFDLDGLVPASFRKVELSPADFRQMGGSALPYAVGLNPDGRVALAGGVGSAEILIDLAEQLTGRDYEHEAG